MNTPGYQRKTIESVIARKIKAWLESIDDENVRSHVSDKIVVTGGAIASMLLGEKVNDFDIYLRDINAARALAHYYVTKFKGVQKTSLNIFVQDDGDRIRIMVKSAGVVGEVSEDNYAYFEQTDPEGLDAEQYLDDAEKAKDNKEQADKKQEYRPVFLSENGITLSNQIQIIIRFHGEPEEIHENYDFVHCTNYWTSWDRKLVTKPEALEALMCRQLKYVGSRYPLCSVIRTRKFINRGWRITAGQYLKMLMQVSDLDLNNIEVLRDQLTGVDAAYFAQIMDALTKKSEETNTVEVDRTYLAQLIDRIF